MTNTVLLNEYIDKSGLKKSYIAKALGIAPGTLSRKIANERGFTQIEIEILCELLNIKTLEDKNAVFFAREVAKTAT